MLKIQYKVLIRADFHTNKMFFYCVYIRHGIVANYLNPLLFLPCRMKLRQIRSIRNLCTRAFIRRPITYCKDSLESRNTHWKNDNTGAFIFASCVLPFGRHVSHCFQWCQPSALTALYP